MLYGEDSTADIKDKEYSPGNTYQLGKIQSSLSDKESTNKALDEYFTKAEEKFSSFYDEYKKNNIIKLNKILSDHGDNLDMLHYELLAPSLNGRAIMSFYANNKKNTDFIDQYFTVHRKSQNQKTIDKANDYKNKVTNFINLLARYDQYKCFNVKNEIVNSSCLVSRDKNFMLLRKEYEEYISYFSDNVIKNSKLVDEIFASIWRVKEVLYEK